MKGGLQLGKFICYNLPDDFRVDSKVIMYKNVSHADHFRPRHFGRQLTDILRN
jgi:hypothetical protein